MDKVIQIKTEYGIYPVRIESDEAGYIATATTLAGVITWGANIAQLKKVAKEAIELCIETLAESTLSKRLEKVERKLKKVEAKVSS